MVAIFPALKIFAPFIGAVRNRQKALIPDVDAWEGVGKPDGWKTLAFCPLDSFGWSL